MNRRHGLFIALMLGAAAAAGTFALARTTAVGAGSSSTVKVSDAAIARWSSQLDHNEASLRKALASKPPKLPKIPRAGATSTAPDTQVVYVHAEPTVVTAHAGGDDEHESGVADGEESELDD